MERRPDSGAPVRRTGAPWPKRHPFAGRPTHSRHPPVGRPAAEVAAEAGFYDQSHFTRHFKCVVGTTPGRYARSTAPRSSASR